MDTRSDEPKRVSYPYYSITGAIDLLEKVAYAAASGILVSEANRIMGFSDKSSSADRAISSLTSYALVTQDGSGTDRMIKLTSLGEAIVFGTENSRQRDEAILDAVWSDDMMKAAMETWPVLESPPSREKIKRTLLQPPFFFTDRAAQRFSAVLDQNFVVLRKIYSKHNLLGTSVEVAHKRLDRNIVPSGSHMATVSMPAYLEGGLNRVKTLPLGEDRQIVLQFPHDVTEAEFKVFVAWVQLLERDFAKKQQTE